MKKCIGFRQVPVLFLVLALVVLGGMDPHSQPPALAADKAVLKIGTAEDLDSLNPFVAYERASVEAFTLIYDSLVTFDIDLEPIPDLAESWELDEDKLTWTFHLRENVKWHDGQPFTSKDVKFTYELVLESGMGLYVDFLNGIESVETPDDSTVIIKTEEPKANMLQVTTPILPEHIWKDIAADELEVFDNSNPIGTGPYKFMEWKKGSHMALEANSDYFRGAPAFEGLIFSIYANRDTMAQSLKLGEIDVVLGLYPSHAKGLKEEANIGICSFEENGFTELAINCWTAPESQGNPVLLDKRVRQAIEWAIDKNMIISMAMEGSGEVGTTLIPPATPFWHYQPSEAELRSYDPDKAGELLEAAGYIDRDQDGVREDADGNKLVLNFLLRSDNTMEVKAGQMIKGYLRDVGIDTTLETVDDGALTDRIYDGGRFDMFIWGWGGDVDPTTMLRILSGDQVGNLNDCYYSNPAYDELIYKQSTVIQPEERQKVVWEAQRLIYEDAPYIILFYDTDIQAYRTDRVGGLQPVCGSGPIFYANTTHNYLNAVPVNSAEEASGGGGTMLWVLAILAVLGVIIFALRRRKPAGVSR